MLIDKEEWSKCSICGCDLDSIVKKYGKGGVYKTQCFKQHLIDSHNIPLEDYFLNRPKCQCGICDRAVGIKIRGANFYYKAVACGRHPGTMRWAKEAKTTRLGEKNPMFGKKPWNFGQTKETSPSVKIVSEKMSNRVISDETKRKQSKSAKMRTVHGHTGYKHSDANKVKFREITLKRIKEGGFNHTNTLPCRLFETLLKNNKIKYEKEKLSSYWSFDFYLPEHNVYIEVDGDYFHSNPKIYPDGPKTPTQKKNYYRDIKKNEYCTSLGFKLLRFWESDILGDIECVKQRLLTAVA